MVAQNFEMCEKQKHSSSKQGQLDTSNNKAQSSNISTAQKINQ